jgi:putative addiction module killer protein
MDFNPIARKLELRKLIIGNSVCPFDEWFETLSVEDQYMVDTRLARVSLGSFGETNSVGGGVFELKFRRGRAIRLYYGRIGKMVLLLITGGDKRTQQKDISTAKLLFKNYRSEMTKDANH